MAAPAPGREAGRARSRAKAQRPATPQGQRLQELAGEVGRMELVYEEVQKNREAVQKRLIEMLEETVRNIKQAHAHIQQKALHVRESSRSYTSKFEHDLAIARDTLHRDLDEATAKMEEAIDALNVRMGATEAALQRQHEERLAHQEATLGVIRDEANRLTEALKGERRARQLQEQEQEKLIADETEAIVRLIEKEKFAREQQLRELERWAEPEQQRASKQQTHLERETRDAAATIRVAHQAMAKERIDNQQRIIESIAGFVNRFRVHLDGSSGLQDLEEALKTAAPAVAAE
uniref:Uncharacterized protein n=1 Tax=Pyrodinium bahamense TaxID=73915 RepID=A0A7R9ZYT0_9DINO